MREPPAQISAHPARDAQAPDQKGPEADQGQVRAQTVKDGSDARRGAVEIPHPPAGFGIGGADGLGGLHGVTAFKAKQVLDAKQTSRLGQASGPESVDADHEPGPQGEKIHDPVRLARDEAAHLKPGFAHAYLVAQGHAKPGQKIPVGHGSGQTALLGQQRVQFPAAFKFQAAVKGIQGIDALEFHQDRGFA